MPLSYYFTYFSIQYMTTWKDVADMIFPDIRTTIAYLQKQYPERPQKVVTRIAPSPT
jgi:hypothetical protein